MTEQREHLINEKKYYSIILEDEISYLYKKIQRVRNKYLGKLPHVKETLQVVSQSYVSLSKCILFLYMKREP